MDCLWAKSVEFDREGEEEEDGNVKCGDKQREREKRAWGSEG